VNSNDAATAARLFVDEIVARYGSPARLLTDRGTNFTATLVSETCRALGVDRSLTTAYHPQTDGMVERFNHTLASMISMYTASHQRDWDVHLGLALAAYRTAHHPSIGTSPYELLFGVRPRLPTDTALALLRSHSDPPLHTDAAAYVKDLHDRLTQAHAAANTVLERERDRQVAQHDANAGPVPDYRVGSLVWLRVPTRVTGLSPKLRHPWAGPYVITELTSPTTMRIATPGRRASSDLVNVNRLKPYTAPWQTPPPSAQFPTPRTSTHSVPTPHPSDDPAKPAESDDLPDGFHQVDRILQHRKRGRGLQYLVRWTAGDETWEPARNLHPDLRRDYHDNDTPRLEGESSAKGGVML